MSRPGTDTRERILGAARELFGDHGVDGTPIRAIAKKARVNLGMIHYFFRTKDNLVDQVIEGYFGRMTQALTELPEGKSARERVEAAIGGIIRALQENQSMVRIMVREYSLQTPRLRRIAERFMGPNFGRLALTLAEGMGSGEFKPLDIRYVAMGTLGMMIYPFVARPLLGQFLDLDFGSPEFAASLADTVKTVLFDGLAARKRTR